MTQSIEFLTVDDLIIAHQGQIALYGGDSGLREIGLLTATARERGKL